MFRREPEQAASSQEHGFHDVIDVAGGHDRNAGRISGHSIAQDKTSGPTSRTYIG
jgi:hypothetical protein